MSLAPEQSKKHMRDLNVDEVRGVERLAGATAEASMTITAGRVRRSPQRLALSKSDRRAIRQPVAQQAPAQRLFAMPKR